jgi:hypothetical protein
MNKHTVTVRNVIKPLAGELLKTRLLLHHTISPRARLMPNPSFKRTLYGRLRRPPRSA